MLHIHNGDSTADKMRGARMPGEHFAFREALATGPTPRGLSAGEWLAARANHLAGGGGLDVEDVKKELSRAYDALGNVWGRDEIILWFEHDLFCQINLIYLLNRLSNQAMGGAKLSLICVGEFPGREDFRGLGELSAEQMASLFEARHEVTPAESSLATKAWEAYCSPDPEAVERLLGGDTSALPYLRGALLQHLARFPSARNGLGRAENKLLGLISNGHGQFASLCHAFFDAEPAYGLGDSQVWRDLERMARAEHPLVVIGGPGDSVAPGSPQGIRKASFSVTETGKAVLDGSTDFVALNGIDLWLGGVHLDDRNAAWRWDERERKLRRPH